jgi:hypothetical protein
MPSDRSAGKPSKRDPSLVRLSRDHHRGLVWAMHIDRHLPTATPPEVDAMYADLLAFWERGLLPHFRTECECLLARLARHHETVSADDESLIDRTQRDHLEVNVLFNIMRDNPEPAVRRETMLRVADLLRRHIRWEETVLFEATQTVFTSEELDALERDVSARIPEMPDPPVWETRDR